MAQIPAELLAILQRATAGTAISPGSEAQLLTWELQDVPRARAWGLTPENGPDLIHQRLRLLSQLARDPPDFPLTYAHFDDLLPVLWQLWLPLAVQLANQRQQLGRPIIQGILGGQGTGKTTLTRSLALILQRLGYRAVSLSIDDLYKTYAERQQIAATDPRLVWRGPPGTHDVGLGCQVLSQLRQGDRIVDLPRFDKSLHSGQGDRTTPDPVNNIDIVLFEGWFVGIRPLPPDQLATALTQLPWPIQTEADCQFAQDCNQWLRDYEPLWDLLDRLMVLCPPDYRLSQQWRRQAEQDMKATGKAGLSDDTIDQFVIYFWRALHPELFIQPMIAGTTAHQSADLVVMVDANHQPGNIFPPGLAVG